MSLNGLDGAAVAEAHQAVLADPAAWFLLRYVNRDTVELLKRGGGGVPEVRSAVESYEEKSPLYGMVQYRRKKVVLKYVPEGTSRLLQVRLTVQFQSVLEALSPHDTIFSFTTASELSESALGLSAMLLPSANSLTSSTPSIHHRRLDGITEDAEDGNAGTGGHAARPAQKEEPHTPTYGSRDLDELPASAVLAKALLAKRKEEAAAAAAATTAADTASDPVEQTTPRPVRKESFPTTTTTAAAVLPSPLPPSTEKSLPATPEPTPPNTGSQELIAVPDFGPTAAIVLDTKAIDVAEPLTPRALHSRHLSAAESDSISQWSSNVASYANVRPKKKKLGPRPHIDAGQRPKTSATVETNSNVRPVANLPNTIRVNNKPLISLGLRPGSQQSTRSVPTRFAPASHSFNGSPPLPSQSHLQSLYKAESRPTASVAGSVTTETNPVAPEKLRLMKALQLRKRNMLLAQRASSATPAPAANAHIFDLSDSSVDSSTSEHPMSRVSGQEVLSHTNDDSKRTLSSNTTSPTFVTNTSEDPSTKASSIADQDALSRKRRSLSSATSSSVTPKAPAKGDQASADNEGAVDVHPAPRGSRSDEEKKLAPTRPTDTKPGPVNPVSKAGAPVPASATPNAGTKSEPSAQQPPPGESAPKGAVRSELAPSSNVPGTQPPLRNVSARTSTTGVSEDDSLMDELQNATVYEAKPMSVARSPVTHIISKGSSDRLRDMGGQAFISNQLVRRSPATTPDRKSSASIRSVSTALPQWPPVQAEPSPALVTPKPALGTGISKRIKALEVLTTKDANAPPHAVPTRQPSSGKAGFTSFMKRTSLILNQPPPNASTDTSPPKKLPAASTPFDPQSAPTSPRYGANSIQKGDTISVTARIVRDPSSKHPPMSPSSNYHTPLNLFRSPLIVEHENRPGAHNNQSLASLDSSTKSAARAERGRFSFSSHRSNSHTNIPRSESKNSFTSMGDNPKKAGTRSISDAASFTDEKIKGSRATRLMKRMSNLTSPRNKSQSLSKDQPLSKDPPQPPPKTIQELSEPLRRQSVSESLLHVVDIGDVNVQFPESLLWKRRFMRIDDQGYLLFAPPTADVTTKNANRRYHLGDFRIPSLPDREREEIAWSIVLDLKDGRCIQCACENKHAQQQVLQMLVDAHSAYHQLYYGPDS